MSNATTTLVEANGFLFIGDPHVSTQQPGRRKDKNFLDTTLDKVGQCIAIANRLRLIPVFTGDMVQRPYEREESLKTRLLRELNQSWIKPISNVGNHDIAGLRLADSDTLSVIAETDSLHVVDESGPAGEFVIHGRRVGLGCTPYGQAIPHDVSPLFPEAVDVVWVSHHDVAFEGAYPNSLRPFEIRGCSLIVNGHMHLYKTPIQVGQTMWCNFGNITRMAVDAIDHEPSAWEFSPFTDEEELKRHVLRYESDIFDVTDRLITQSETQGPGTINAESTFVQLLETDLKRGPADTADGQYLREELEPMLQRFSADEAVRGDVLALFKQVVDTQEAA